MTSRFLGTRSLAALICLAALVTSCSNDEANGDTEALQVVAAENFYGDIASAIGGEHVKVTSVLNGQDVDPHSFEPDTSTALSVSSAAVVIENGLDYDHFMHDLLDSSPSEERRVVTIADVVGAQEGDNPHLWYDIDKLDEIAMAIGASLREADPENSSAYEANQEKFIGDLKPLQDLVSQMRAQHEGKTILATEPVAGYLVDEVGLRDATPSAFAQAIQNEIDPSPADITEFTSSVAGGIDALIYNDQTQSNVTELVRTAAETANVPVVPMSETMPADQSFIEWQTAQVTSLQKALDS